jgi:DNA-binding response OmpR family regulator
MMKLALLDHDAACREAMEGTLSAAGFLCTCFHSGRQLLRSLQRDTHDALLVDWNLPDLAGPNLLEGIRNQIGATLPVLLLTAPLPQINMAQALNTGADCVLAKPCAPELVIAQLRALARRTGSGHALSIETYGRYSFSLATRTVLVDGVAPHVTPKEFTLALLLFRNLNQAVSRSYILETIWGIDPRLSTRTLDIHISKIRTKLALKPENGFRLSPVYGYGYRLEEFVA